MGGPRGWARCVQRLAQVHPTAPFRCLPADDSAMHAAPARIAPARDAVIVATKAAGPSGQMAWIRGGPAALDAANIAAAIDGSLKRLGTDHIDLYQLHWPDR